MGCISGRHVIRLRFEERGTKFARRFDVVCEVVGGAVRTAPKRSVEGRCAAVCTIGRTAAPGRYRHAGWMRRRLGGDVHSLIMLGDERRGGPGEAIRNDGLSVV